MTKTEIKENGFTVRLARAAEIDDILNIYDDARAFMRTAGNPTQWSGGYPSREVLLGDIAAGQLYVCEDAGSLLAAFVFFVGEEEVYKTFDGDWGSDSTIYGVIHRVAVRARGRGLGAAILAYGYARAPGDLRIDTHRDNHPMRALLAKHGFVACGTVDYGAAGKRIAYRKWEK